MFLFSCLYRRCALIPLLTITLYKSQLDGLVAMCVIMTGTCFMPGDRFLS
jgi:hypothetical protein